MILQVPAILVPAALVIAGILALVLYLINQNPSFQKPRGGTKLAPPIARPIRDEG